MSTGFRKDPISISQGPQQEAQLDPTSIPVGSHRDHIRSYWGFPAFGFQSDSNKVPILLTCASQTPHNVVGGCNADGGASLADPTPAILDLQP